MRLAKLSESNNISLWALVRSFKLKKLARLVNLYRALPRVKEAFCVLPWPWRAVLKGHQLKHPSCTSNPTVQNSTMRPWFPFPMVSQSKPHALHENLSVETSSQTRGCSMHKSSRCPRQMEQEEVPKGHDLIEHCVPLRAIACHCVVFQHVPTTCTTQNRWTWWTTCGTQRFLRLITQFPALLCIRTNAIKQLPACEISIRPCRVLPLRQMRALPVQSSAPVFQREDRFANLKNSKGSKLP